MTSAFRMPYSAWLLMTWLATALAVGIPYALGGRIWIGMSLVEYIVYTVLLVSAACLAVIVARGADRIVSLFFWIYVYLFLGLAPFIQLSRRRFIFPGVYADSELLKASLIVVIGLGSYCVGRRRRRAAAKRRSFFERFANREVNYRRVNATGVMALVSLPLLIGRVGGFSALLSSRQAVGEALGYKSTFDYGGNALAAVVVAFLGVPVAVAGLLAFGGIRSAGRSDLRRNFSSGWLILVVGATILVNNPLGTSRFWFGTIAISYLCIYMRLDRAKVFRIFSVCSIVVIVFVFPYADRFRYEESASANTMNISDVLTQKGDHDSFQQIANAVRLVDDVGFSFGRQLIGVATFWVPRSAWPGKPTDTGPVIAKHEGYQLENVSSPLWAEGYVDFGILGTMFFLYQFGIVSQALESSWLDRNRSHRGKSAAHSIVPMFAAYQLILLRGPLLQAVGRPVLVVALLLLCSRSRIANLRPSGKPSDIPAAV